MTSTTLGSQHAKNFASASEKPKENVGELHRFGCSIMDEVILHFGNTSMLVDQRVLTGCPVFSAAFKDNSNGKNRPELTIEKYSKKAVIQVLWHLYDGDEDTFDQSNFYSTLSDEFLPEAMDEARLSAEIFCLADEYQLPLLRSQAQANIMSIRKRAIQLNDSFFATLVRDNVLSIYDKNCELDMSMLDELAKQCLEYECVREWHTLGLFSKIEGVWVAQQEEYESLVKRLNVLDTGMTPIPMDRKPKSEADKWTW